MNQLIKLFEKYDFKLLANLDFRTKTGAYFIAFQKIRIYIFFYLLTLSSNLKFPSTI